MANILYKSNAYLAPNWTNSAIVTLTLTSSDVGGSSVTQAEISSSPNFSSYTTVPITTSPQTESYTLADPTVDGKKYIYVRYRNANGNVSQIYSTSIYLDTTNPTKPGQPYSNSSWSTNDSQNNPQIIWNWTASFDQNSISSYSIQIEEDTGSGYSLKKEDGTTDTQYTYKNIIDDAQYRIRVKAIDLVGKESSWSQYGTIVTADVVAPHDAMITVANSNHTAISETETKDVEIKVEAVEDVDESGLKRVRFRNKPLKTSHDGNTIEYEVSNWSSWFTFTSSPSYYEWSLPDNSYGDIKVEAQIQDVSQNSTYVTDTVTALRGFIIDTIAPSGSMEINDGDPSSDDPTVKLDLIGSDVTTDIYAMRFRDSNRSWSDWEPFDSIRYYSMESTEGLKVVEAQFRDYGGNVVSDVDQLFDKNFIDSFSDTIYNFLTNERISKFVIHDDSLYAFSKGSSANDVYAKMYQFLNNQFIEIYKFDTEEEYEIGAVASFGGNIYVGTSKTSSAKVYLYNLNSATMSVSSNFSDLEDRINALEVYNNTLYAASGDGYVYIFDGVSWSSRGDTETIDTGETTVIDLQVYNNYLHIATGNSGNMYTFDGDNLSSAMTTSTQFINHLTIVNDLLVGISQATNEIYIYQEILDNTIWGERLLFNREPSDTKNTVVWNKFSSGSPTIDISQGEMEIYAPQGSTLLYTEDELGQTWFDGVSNTTGWTLQINATYNDTSLSGEQGIRFSDGVYGGALHFDSTQIKLIYGKNNVSYNVDMSKPHEIRIVGQNTNIKVFVDRIEVISITDWDATNSNKVLQFGDVALYEASKAKWNSLRISTTGGYEPTDVASRSDITVIPWYANSVISDISTMDVMRNATDIEDEITTVLVNDASINEITTEIDDVNNAIGVLNSFIGSDSYNDIFENAISNDQLNEDDDGDGDVTEFKNKFNTSEGHFSNISSSLSSIKTIISSLDEINIQSTLTSLDTIVANTNYYTIAIEDIIEVDIPSLPSPRDEEEIDELLDEINMINTTLAEYIVELDVIIEDLSKSGDEVYISGRNNAGQAQIWSTFDFSTYTSVVTLDNNINVTYAMELFPTDDVGGDVENRMFISGFNSNNSQGYLKLIRDSYIADDILLDTTAPTGAIIISPDGSGDGAEQTNSNIVTLKLTGSDALSGIYEYALSGNDDFSATSYSKWAVSPTWITNYNLTSTETAFVETTELSSDIISLVEFDNMLYMGTQSGEIYRSSDLEAFTLVFDGSSAINALAVHENKIYAGTQNGVLLESDNGALNQWTTKAAGLVNSSGGSDVVPIYCMQTINSVLYIGGGNSLLNYFEFGTLNYLYNFSETAVLSLSSFIKSGSTYILVGTSDAGKIFMLDPSNGTWSVVLNTEETEISLDFLRASKRVFLYALYKSNPEINHKTTTNKRTAV